MEMATPPPPRAEDDNLTAETPSEAPLEVDVDEVSMTNMRREKKGRAGGLDVWLLWS